VVARGLVATARVVAGGVVAARLRVGGMVAARLAAGGLVVAGLMVCARPGHRVCFRDRHKPAPVRLSAQDLRPHHDAEHEQGRRDHERETPLRPRASILFHSQLFSRTAAVRHPQSDDSVATGHSTCPTFHGWSFWSGSMYSHKVNVCNTTITWYPS
jgi:hypothetical protein